MKKSIKHFTLAFISILAFSFTYAQSADVADSLVVNGNCGMCKKNIEKSATEAGATYAFWDRKTKMLNIKYDASKTDRRKIEQKIAEKGYDTENVKASEEAYNKLEECCQYERKELKPAKQ